MLQCNSLLINDPPREIFQKVDKVSFRITVNHLSVFYKRLPIRIYKKTNCYSTKYLYSYLKAQ